MSSKFAYEALQSPSAEIRLLELLPGVGRARLQCRLSTFSMSSLPAYQPLSYCWGCETNPAKILVNGKDFSVTSNLAAALRRLRLPNISCVLWVDAICINQSDNVEKSSQIPLMGKIYGRGEKTVIWLGEHDHETSRAFVMLETMAQYADSAPKEKLVRLHPDKWQLLTKSLRKGSPVIPPEVSNLQLHNPAYWIRKILSGHARTSVFGRPWFTRVWIIQEISASKQAVVLCGKYSIGWDILEKAYEASEYWDEWDDGRYLRTLIEIRANTQAGARNELSSLLLKTAYCNAERPVDRIYAVLGLASKLPTGLEIAIDYTADTIAKFSETTRVCIASTCNPQLVLDVRGRPADYDGLLPSWAWSPQLDPEQPTYQWQFHRGAATRCEFKAAEKLLDNPAIRFSDDGRLLFVRGIVFDNTVEIGPIFGEKKMVYTLSVYPNRVAIRDSHTPLRRFRNLQMSKQIADVTSLELYPRTSETRREAWISFLTGIVAMSDGKPDDYKIKEAMHLEETYMKPFHIMGRGSGELPWSRKMSKNASLRDPQMPRKKLTVTNVRGLKMETALMEYLAKRRVVRTSQGYIGLCNCYTEVGDRLALIEGVCVPVVLRPASGGRWRIIGEAYVYGIMHGELWSSDQAQSLCIE